MRKDYIWILAIVALLGFANCLLVEQAFACNEDVAACSTPISDGCLGCHHVGHQSVAAQSFHLLSIHNLAHAVNSPSAEISVDPPLGSIFHPPTVL